MELTSGLIHAVFSAFLPVGALTFTLTWWALRRGMLVETGGFDALSKEINKLGKMKKEERERSNPVHDKWFKFGGGFYGVVALYTYVLIEWDEVLDLLSGLRDLVFRLDISILINFFIESLTNFIAAVTWPLYWLNRTSGEHFWLWLMLAYAGYWTGAKMAQRRMV